MVKRSKSGEVTPPKKGRPFKEFGENVSIPEIDERVGQAIKRAQQEIDKYEQSREISQESALRAFQIRVKAALAEKGWNYSDLARAYARIKGGKVDRSKPSSWLKDSAIHLPRPTTLAIIARALGVDKEMLLPARERLRTGLDRRSPTVEVKDTGAGLAWLKVNQAVEWSVALEVMRILKESHGGKTTDDEGVG